MAHFTTYTALIRQYSGRLPLRLHDCRTRSSIESRLSSLRRPGTARGRTTRGRPGRRSSDIGRRWRLGRGRQIAIVWAALGPARVRLDLVAGDRIDWNSMGGEAVNIDTPRGQ